MVSVFTKLDGDYTGQMLEFVFTEDLTTCSCQVLSDSPYNQRIDYNTWVGDTKTKNIDVRDVLGAVYVSDVPQYVWVRAQIINVRVEASLNESPWWHTLTATATWSVMVGENVIHELQDSADILWVANQSGEGTASLSFTSLSNSQLYMNDPRAILSALDPRNQDACAISVTEASGSVYPTEGGAQRIDGADVLICGGWQERVVLRPDSHRSVHSDWWHEFQFSLGTSVVNRSTLAVLNVPFAVPDTVGSASASPDRFAYSSRYYVDAPGGGLEWSALFWTTDFYVADANASSPSVNLPDPTGVGHATYYVQYAGEG
jgi:hypothetical protein